MQKKRSNNNEMTEKGKTSPVREVGDLRQKKIDIKKIKKRKNFGSSSDQHNNKQFRRPSSKIKSKKEKEENRPSANTFCDDDDDSGRSGAAEAYFSKAPATKRFRYSDKEVYHQATMEDLERLISGYLQKGLPRHVAQQIKKKWQAREARRLKRQQDKNANKVCFGCRKLGHQLADCPERQKNTDFSTGICFKCGSTEHRIACCPKKVKGFPFAKCFVCGDQGHLSRSCKNNPNGVYPDGGTCKECGMRDHLVKDCPQNTKNSTPSSAYVAMYRSKKHISADDEDNVLLDSEIPKPKKRTNVVSF